MASSIKLEIIYTGDGEMVHVDPNDILDILDKTPKDGYYLVIFKDGEIWRNATMKKPVFNRFVKLKGKRGQIDNGM